MEGKSGKKGDAVLLSVNIAILVGVVGLAVGKLLQ